jgi:hypothetical protein
MTTQPQARPHPLVRATRRLARTLAWALVATLGLVTATTAAYGLGYAVYTWRGKPHNHQDQQRFIESGIFLSNAFIRRTDGEIADMRVGVPERVFLNSTRHRWREARGGFLRHGPAASATYWTAPDGIVTRYTLVVNGIEKERLRPASARLHMAMGPSDAIILPPDPVTPAEVLLVWRKQDRMATAEFRPESDGSFTLLLQQVHRLDPRFALRHATGGLPRWHRHAARIAEQLATASEGSVGWDSEDVQIIEERR